MRLRRRTLPLSGAGHGHKKKHAVVTPGPLEWLVMAGLNSVGLVYFCFLKQQQYAVAPSSLLDVFP